MPKNIAIEHHDSKTAAPHEEKPGFWHKIGNFFHGDKQETAATTPNKNLGALDVGFYKHVPRDYEKPTGDMVKRLNEVPEGTIVVQTRKTMDVNGVPMVGGSMAQKHNGKITCVPFASGGHKVPGAEHGGGADAGLVYGDGNYDPRHGCVVHSPTITGVSNRHQKDWGTPVADLSSSGPTGRVGVLVHADARIDGTSSACYVYPRTHKAQGDKMLYQAEGHKLERLPSEEVGGLAYNHAHTRDDRARQLADAHSKNPHSQDHGHGIKATQAGHQVVDNSLHKGNSRNT